MDTLRKSEEDIICMDYLNEISRHATKMEEDPSFVELAQFYESMREQGLLLKQPYSIKPTNPVENEDGPAWFRNHLARNSRSG